MNRQLTAHFWLHEFVRSETASRMGRPIEIPDALIPNLVKLCADVLQPLRTHLGRPIQILSGYRPGWLNTAIGGSLSSEHMDARAADFVVSGMSGMDNIVVCNEIIALGLPFNQLILEFPPNGWIHVSVPPIGIDPKKQVLTAVKRGGRTEYFSGIRPQ